MKRIVMGSLTSLLMPFAAQGAHMAYGSYQRRPSIQVPDAQALPLDALRNLPPTRAHGVVDGALEIRAGAPVRELLIMDSDVPDKAVLRSALRPGVETVVLQPGRDVLAQIEDVLRGYHGLSAVHLVSHGEAGALLLGGQRVDAQALQHDHGLLQALDAATVPGADLMLYACDVAASDDGLLEIVQQQSHLDVAASSNATGAAALGGDWNLEIEAGDIETGLAFSDKALMDFSAVLRPFGTKTFETLTTELYQVNPSFDLGDFTAYIASTNAEILGGINSGACIDDLYINMLYADSRFYIRSDPSGETFGVTELVLRKSNSYNTTSVNIEGFATVASTTAIASKNNIAIPGDQSPVTVDLTSGLDMGSFAEVAKIRITPNDADLCINSITFTPLDTDGNLIAAGGVSEPVALDTTVDTAAEAVDVLDFTLSDGGGSDNQALAVSQVVVNVSGSASDAERGQVTWRLNGSDASNVSGIYNASTDTITFSGLGISVADGGSETYTVNAYFNDTSNLVDGHGLELSIDGDSDLVVDASGTGMGSTSPVGNGSGSLIEVTASQLVFSTQPAGSVSGIALTTQPVVAARDAAGNVDADFAETVTLTEASAGTLSGNTQTASNGVATFTSLAYSASADQESFTLTANDEDGVGTNLPTVAAGTMLSDVVATGLLFTQQPAPTSIPSGASTSFGIVPVVSAVDANGTLDTGYATGITLAEANGAGSANLSGTGDSDGDSTTVTVAPANGVAIFSGLAITYSGSDSFNLRASSGALASADSVPISASTNNPPTDISLNSSSVNQSEGVNGLVGVLSTTDLDSADTFIYTLAGAVGDNASFNINGDQLRADDAGAMAPGNYTVAIQTQDAAGATFQKFFTVTVVDDVVPAVTSVTVPADGTYAAGQDLDFTVNLSENIAVDTSGGTPRIPITLGSAIVYAGYIGGSGTSALTFRYTVNSGDSDTDGIQPGAAIDTNGATLQDAAGNNLDTTLNAVGATHGVLVDAVAPTGHSVSLDDGAINASEATATSFTFTGAELGAGYSYSISSSGGGTPITGSGTIFSATAQVSGIDVTGLADGTLTLSVTLTDSAGNSAPAVTDTGSLDTQAPSITSVALPADGIYLPGETLDFELDYDEPVTVDTSGGVPELTLTIGSTTRAASYISGSGTTSLLFRYTVQNGDEDNDGIALAPVISTNGATLRDSVGNDADTSLGNFGSLAGVLVDTASPDLAISIADDRAYGRYGQMQDYLVTVSNSGTAAATGVALTTSYSSGLDTAYAQWQCFGGGASTQPGLPHCDPASGSGAVNSSIDLPVGASLTFLVSVPVDPTTAETDVQATVDLHDGTNGVDLTASDTNRLVVFRDGFDVPYADGTQRPAQPSAGGHLAAPGCATGAYSGTVVLPVLPASAGAGVQRQYTAKLPHGREVALQGFGADASTWLRLLAQAPGGGQRVSSWALAQPGTSLAIGLADDGHQRWLLLEGEKLSLRLPLMRSSSEGRCR